MEAKEKRKKPKYNMWQNVVYMVKNAWKVRKSVLFIATAMGTVTAALTVTRLLVTPIVLKYVEKSASLSSLILVILVFSFLLVGLSGVLAYLKDNKLFGRIDVRSSIILDVATKFCETSYSNLMDTDFIEANDSATRATGANSRSTEHIWETLQEILANILGFVAFLFVVTGLDMRLMAVVIMTSGLSYLISKKIDENAENPEYEEKIGINFLYMINNATNRTLAKDIRIFGLKNWID
ncbi:MAG: ABC transporter ATP-binding protein, partial [Butyrivibrio sp.]|nr:ABC transporter ATP-binding protein [Butyrivibrio sp.]